MVPLRMKDFLLESLEKRRNEVGQEDLRTKSGSSSNQFETDRRDTDTNALHW